MPHQSLFNCDSHMLTLVRRSPSPLQMWWVWWALLLLIAAFFWRTRARPIAGVPMPEYFPWLGTQRVMLKNLHRLWDWDEEMSNKVFKGRHWQTCSPGYPPRPPHSLHKQPRSLRIHRACPVVSHMCVTQHRCCGSTRCTDRGCCEASVQRSFQQFHCLTTPPGGTRRFLPLLLVRHL
jgi:hypothetical protein